MMEKKLKQQILEELGGIPEEIYDALVVEFYQQCDSQVRVIRDAIARTDWPCVMVEAHSIKGAAANLRLPEMIETARALEAAGKAGQPDLMEPLLKKLEAFRSTRGK